MIRNHASCTIMLTGLLALTSACGGGSDEPASPLDVTADNTAEPTGATVVDDTSDVTADDPVSDASSGDDDTPSSDGDISGDPFDPLLGDLPQPCTLISSDEVAAVIGTDLVSDDTFATDCFYEPTDTSTGGATVHTATLALPADQCADFIQTEAFLPGEEVEAASGYGDLATLITTDHSAEYQVCSAGIAFSVSVNGDSDNADQLKSLAADILNLLIERS